MNEQLFEKLGLTKGEIKVYLALNKIGESTVGPIGNESKVSKSKIYDILEKLIDKGLVGSIIKEGTKYFVTNNPHMILNYVEKKEEELAKTKKEVETLLPKLLAERLQHASKRQAEVFEGYQGIKAIREELLFSMNPNETFLVLGAPKIANEKYEGWLLAFHKQRIQKKIKMQILYNANAKEYGNVRKKMSLTEVKYLPLINPNWIDIFPNAVLFVALLEKPIGFVIRDKTFAESFKSYFTFMWKNAKET